MGAMGEGCPKKGRLRTKMSRIGPVMSKRKETMALLTQGALISTLL
jgi:hypothetical protein